MAPRLNHFPEELLLEICGYMGAVDLGRCLRLCQSIHLVAATDDLWQIHCRAVYACHRSPEECHLQLFQRIIPQLTVVDLNCSEKPKKPPFTTLIKRMFSLRKRQVFTNHILGSVPIHASLSKALRASPRGPKPPKGAPDAAPFIVLSPGEYRETTKDGTLVVGRDCHLVAASYAAGDVSVHVPMELAHGVHVVRFVEFTAVVEAKSTTTFEDCVFLAGLALFGGPGHCVRRCRIADARGSGLTIHPGAGALVEACEIAGNHGPGVDVQTAVPESVTILQCDIHDNSNGIVVTKPCNCHITQNKIHGNHAPGINVKGTGTATITHNKIYDGNWGIVLKEAGGGDVSNNECYRNTHSAICLQTSGAVTIVKNNLHHETRGVVVTGKQQGDEPPDPASPDPSRPRIEDNDFEANNRSAISVKNGANPLILGNRIHSGRWGIVVQKRARGLIQGNDISNNSRPGIGIKTYANPEVERNRIHHGGAMGLICNENGTGVIRDNEFYSNGHSAITIRSGGNPHVVGNTIRDEKRGLAISDRGAGVIENNDIFTFTKTGITIKSGGCPTVRHNRIHGGRQGLTVHEQGEGLVEDNLFFDNSALNLGLKRGGRTVVRNNRQGRIVTPGLAAPTLALSSRFGDGTAEGVPDASSSRRVRAPEAGDPVPQAGPEGSGGGLDPAPEQPAGNPKGRCHRGGDRDAEEGDSDSDESDESDAEGDFARCL